ncbi:MAG: DHA2 family efflux MFS transporter permease subunit [Solirubrobacteraceae bacterium]
MPSTTTRAHLTATLILACLAQFMVILDVSVVNVALPSIKHALGFSESGLQWVINAYTITFAGFLLLGGRATDLLGRRRVFVSGLLLFSLSSLVGGMANSQAMLIIARLAQGAAGAVVAPASLSILTSTFTEPKARHRALGAWGAMGGAGAAAGVLLGGLIVELVSWRWILFINVPIGVTTVLFSLRLLLAGRSPHATRNFDLTGAITATAGLSATVYAIVGTNTHGWSSQSTIVPLAIGAALLIAFLVHEGRFAKAPLMPLGLFRSRRLSVANVTIALVGASTFAMWFFLSLYAQDVLGYSPLRTGIFFLPMTVAIVIGSAFASRVAMRVGPRRLLAVGMAMLAAGLALFTRIGTHGDYLGVLLAPSLLTSFGMPLAFIPSTISATTGVKPHQAGLASAVTSSARMMGGALGLAVLATVANSRSVSDLRHPTFAIHSANTALVNGFQVAFWIAAAIAAVGVIVAIIGMPPARSDTASAGAGVTGATSAGSGSTTATNTARHHGVPVSAEA